MNECEINKVLFGIEINSNNRFRAFLKLTPKLKGKGYWYALRNSYDSSDNLFECSGLVKAAFLKDEPGKEYLMSNEEREYLKQLPATITIYRGMTENELIEKKFGCSWTLKKDVADFFANSYLRNVSTNHLKKLFMKPQSVKAKLLPFSMKGKSLK